MHLNKKFIISSVSASGKTTLVNYILANINSIYKLKTCTTRPMRNEEHGDEYYFLSVGEMNNKILNNEMIEYSLVYNNFYGLSKVEVESHNNKNIIAILDVQGTKKFKNIYPDAISIFIEPPSITILKERLIKRNTLTNDITIRLNSIYKEISYMNSYDYIIHYNDLNIMKNDIINFICKNIEN